MKTLGLQPIFDSKLHRDDFVLMYQMGKLSRFNIEAALQKHNIPNWKIQTFDDCEEFLIYQNTKDVRCFFDWHFRTAYKILLSHRCRILQKKQYLKILSIVEDPIETVVSSFFEDLHIQLIKGKKTSAIYGDIEETLHFLMNAFDEQVKLNYFTDWFDKEIRKNFDVDIANHIRSPSKHYWRIEQSGRDILLIKIDEIEELSPILANFLEQPRFRLINSQQKTYKWYSELYQLFKKNYPFERLFHLYQTPIYQKLYSKKEIENFKSKWSEM